MSIFIFDSKRTEELEKIRDILIDSNAVSCEYVAPEIMNNGSYSYLLHGHDHKVIVDFDKMADALYKAGYRKGEIYE